MYGVLHVLGETVFSTGIKDVDTEILPKLSALANNRDLPWVLPSYSILYWFSVTLLLLC